MLVLSVVATVPVAIAQEEPSQTVETLENGEDLYLSFGADLGDQTFEEYVQAHLDDNSESNVEIVQYQDVGQVNVHEEGQAVSIAIGGGDATAIQQVDQQNNNVQEAEADAENLDLVSQETTFEDVGDVYLIMGDGPNQQYDGWGVADDEDVRVSQTAEASVAQAQSVQQANVIQNTTALAFAENGSEATAIQITEQSNQNLQEGAASAANVYADEGEAPERNDKRDKPDDGVAGNQTANATVEQAQEVDQFNVNQQGAAVAIAVGENSTATAIQMTDQSNINEQLGSAEAINVMLQSAGMNIATAGVDGGSDVVNYDGEAHEDDPDTKKGDKAGVVNQTAEASVTQYQSVEQLNLNLDSAAQAIATNGSTADAVQLTYQQNINAQIASAEALNVFIDEDSMDEKDLKKLDGEESEYEGVVLTNTTVATVGGESVDGVDRMSFDYDGSHDELNSVEQWSTAEVEQSQNITQVNYQSNTAFAVADDDGEASAVQVTIQENENVQFTSSESTTHESGDVGGEDTDEKNDKKSDDKDDEKDEKNDTEKDNKSEKDNDSLTSDDEERENEKQADEERDDDEMPGFGIAVAFIALLVAGMLAVRNNH